MSTTQPPGDTEMHVSCERADRNGRQERYTQPERTESEIRVRSVTPASVVSPKFRRSGRAMNCGSWRGAISSDSSSIARKCTEATDRKAHPRAARLRRHDTESDVIASRHLLLCASLSRMPAAAACPHRRRAVVVRVVWNLRRSLVTCGKHAIRRFDRQDTTNAPMRFGSLTEHEPAKTTDAESHISVTKSTRTTSR